MAAAHVTASSQLGFPPKGSLKRYPFPRLMREVARGKLTGSLYLLSGQTKKVVFFEAGQPVFVRSNVLAECLGQVLSREGLITQEQCEQTLEAIRRTGKKQGELLVEMGVLSQGNLRYGLEAQLRAKLFDIFAWEDGRYQFKVDPVSNQFGIRLHLGAEGVIVGAIQDQYSEDRARESLEPFVDKYLVITGGVPLESLELLPEELHFVAGIDGSRTVGDVLASTPDPPVPSLSALVFGLLQAGVAQLSEHAMKPSPAPAPLVFDKENVADKQLAPAFEAQDVVAEYEDTPLPPGLPQAPPLGDDDAPASAEVEDNDSGGVSKDKAGARAEVPEELVAAEPESVEETFEDEQIELADDEVEIVEAERPHPHPTGSRTLPGFEPADVTDAARPAYDATANLELTRGSPGSASVAAANDPRTAAPAGPIGSDYDPKNPPGGAETADARALADTGAAALLEGDELDEVDLPPLDAPLDTADLATSGLEPAPISVDVLAGLDEGGGEAVRVQVAPGEHELVGFDELDGIDLDAEAAPKIAGGLGSAASPSSEGNPEKVGAIRFNEAELAMNRRDYPQAVTLLEAAYQSGFDVAELHAMLAFARFMAAGQDMRTAQHAFELLDYAQHMDPSLDLVHAYRGAVYRALQQPAAAKEALDRALELNPYCELAMELKDSLAPSG